MNALTGKWKVVVHTYMGDQFATHELTADGDRLTGKVIDGGNGNSTEILDGKVDGNRFSYHFALRIPIGDMEFAIEGELLDDGSIKGSSTNPMGTFEFDGTKEA